MFCTAIVAVSRDPCSLAMDEVRPNGLAFSCRERAGNHIQKANDLARAAVCCNAGLGRGSGITLPSLNPVFDYSRWRAIDSLSGTREPRFIKQTLFFNRYRLNVSTRCKDIHQVGHSRVFAHC